MIPFYKCPMSKVYQNISSALSLSDEKAMARVRDQDDHAAFALLMKRWEGPIRRLCVRMMNDEQRGEDLCQESFAKLFQKRKSYKATAKFSTYFWRVAMNMCYDELRKRKRQWEQGHQHLDSEGEDGLPVIESTPLHVAAENEEAELVRQAVAKLPETYRSVLILRHYEGLKLREIAEVLEIPSGTVNSRMAEALARLSRTLRPKLDKECDVPTSSPASASPPPPTTAALRLLERALEFFRPTPDLSFAS